MTRTLYAYWAGTEVDSGRRVFDIAPDHVAEGELVGWTGYSETQMRREAKRWRRRGFRVVFDSPPSWDAEAVMREKHFLEECLGFPPETLH